MNSFIEQLDGTTKQLKKLVMLHDKHPDLFEHASGISISESEVVVYVHAWRNLERNWKAYLKQFPAMWLRESSASNCNAWNYTGQLDGVKIKVLEAEMREEPKPLFTEEGRAA